MMINLSFTQDELVFLKDAMFEKYDSLMAKIDDAEEEAIPSFMRAVQYPIKHAQEPVEAKKKPHWTQTPEGKKKMAARKRAAK